MALGLRSLHAHEYDALSWAIQVIEIAGVRNMNTSHSSRKATVVYSKYP